MSKSKLERIISEAFEKAKARYETLTYKSLGVEAQKKLYFEKGFEYGVDYAAEEIVKKLGEREGAS